MTVVGGMGFSPNVIIANGRQGIWMAFPPADLFLTRGLVNADGCLVMSTRTTGLTRGPIAKVVAGEFEMVNGSASAED